MPEQTTYTGWTTIDLDNFKQLFVCTAAQHEGCLKRAEKIGTPCVYAVGRQCREVRVTVELSGKT